MGEENGETNPFLYFVSHGDPDLVEAVREGRRKEFAAFAWAAEVADPQSAQPRFAQLRLLYADLLALRKTDPALRAGAARVTVRHDAEARWVSLHPHSESSALSAALFREAPR